jgi:uncharacterized protein (TIGR00251 family)
MHVQRRNDAVEIWVHVRPRASRASVGGTQGDALAVSVRAAPTDGQANRAVCEAVAAALGAKRRQVSLVAGDTSRRKRLRIEGDPSVLAARLDALASSADGWTDGSR